MKISGLRRLIAIKNKELKHMKSLAATILAQRSETEQFFLEALQEVKEVILKERRMRSAQESKQLMNQMKSGGGTGAKKDGGTCVFPSLNIKGSQLHLLDDKAVSSTMKLGEFEKVRCVC